MKTEGTLQDWVKGFEDEVRKRFNPDIRVFIRTHKVNSSKELEPFFEPMTKMVKMVSEVSGIEFFKFFNTSRGTFAESDARMVAIVFIYNYVVASKQRVGEFFNRHHTSVIHAINTVKDRIDSKDKFVTELVLNLEKKIAEKNENGIQNITDAAGS